VLKIKILIALQYILPFCVISIAYRGLCWCNGWLYKLSCYRGSFYWLCFHLFL